jgi:hypothetical protein
MSCHWKSTLVGGGAKVKTRFCMNCCCTSDEISTPSEVPCKPCEEKGPDTDFGKAWLDKHGNDWKCYHHEFGDNDFVQKCQAAMDELIEEHNVTMEAVKSSKLIFYTEERNQQSASSDVHSIDFLPVSIKEAEKYSELLLDECILRGIDIFDVDEEDRRNILRTHLSVENEIRRFQDNLAHCSVKEDSLYASLYAIPCILHMENRCNLKAMTMMFIDGLSNAQGSLLPETVAIQSMASRENIFVGSVEEVMNSSILGDEFNRTFWRCPVEKGDTSTAKKVGIVSLSNGRSRKVLESIDDLIDLCIVNPDKNKKWKTAWAHYREAFVILRKSGEDYTKEEIETFQDKIDIFFQLWVELHQHEGLTNYIHMLGSGHVKRYMQEWGNLNKYSQQGWESLNALIKSFFFRRTNRGGSNRGDRSKLVPIGKLLQRRLMWLCNLTDDMFQNYDSIADNGADLEEEDIDNFDIHSE